MMMHEITTDQIALATQFVNTTSRHLFLTGKAGTGKTTFLRSLVRSTHKRHLIVAPTGIAALNAKGVTIHSQFLLPPVSFIPERNVPPHIPENMQVAAQMTLARKHPLNGLRRQVLREIDLLIIDEVSMLRCDLLDAIDYRLRSARHNQSPFGGVQLLLIGDLFQLPPIVRDQEWAIMRQYYNSVHFFESRALRKAGFIYLELDKIFRQQDELFIRILNNLRNNVITREDIQVLNQHYRSPEAIKHHEGVVTLTTHNNQADEINRKALNELPGELFAFTANTEGEFPEWIYPVPARIELKVGAQVMFVKNDSQEGRYFNGKIARVHHLDPEEGITVMMDDHPEPYVLRRFQWENKKYTIDPATKDIEEEVIGTFDQYPVKLAWAITVHKSQGLTFDKAIIDVGRAFAPGQVYVALSRLRSLDGLMLRTLIDPNVVATDEMVVRFSQVRDTQGSLDPLLKEGQRLFLKEVLDKAFDFGPVISEIDHLRKQHGQENESEDSAMWSALRTMSAALTNESENTLKFRSQLGQLLAGDNREQLMDRIGKGQTYYESFLTGQLRSLLLHIETLRGKPRNKTYLNDLGELDTMMTGHLQRLRRTTEMVSHVLLGIDLQPSSQTEARHRAWREQLLAEVRAEARLQAPAAEEGTSKTKTRKKSKGSTYEETYKLLEAGHDIAEIARQRELTESTIETHLCRGLRNGRISITRLVSDELIAEINALLDGTKDESLSAAYNRSEGKYSFRLLNFVKASRQSGDDQ